ncbi:MAG: T9SS type A sorting domain-containing protein [bacterium]
MKQICLSILTFLLSTVLLQAGQITLQSQEPLTTGWYDEVQDTLGFGKSNDTLRIYDVQDLLHPVLLSELATGSCIYDIGEDGSLLAIAHEPHPGQVFTGITIWDISNPSSPDSLAGIPLSSVVTGVEIQDSLVYVSNGGYGLQIFDISNLDNIIEIGEYTSDIWAWNVIVAGEFAIVSDASSGLLYLYSVADPSSISELGHAHIIGSYEYDWAVRNDTLFVLAPHELAIFKFTQSGLAEIASRKTMEIRIPHDWNLFGKTFSIDRQLIVTSEADDLKSFLMVGDSLFETASIQAPDYTHLKIINESLLAVISETTLSLYTMDDVTLPGDSNKPVQLPDRFTIANIFPNPTNSMISVRLTASEAFQARLEIFDLLGRRVHQRNGYSLIPGTQTYSMDLSGLTSGRYWLTIEAAGYSKTRSFVLLR